jgi:hypothetical protein
LKFLEVSQLRCCNRFRKEWAMPLLAQENSEGRLWNKLLQKITPTGPKATNENQCRVKGSRHLGFYNFLIPLVFQTLISSNQAF